MKITETWLEKHSACKEGKEFFIMEGITEPIAGVRNLLNKNKVNWANWLIVRLLNSKQKIKYAVYAANQVLFLFEKKYPNDKRPRLAIKAVLLCLKNNTVENRNNAAANAAYAANAAAYAVDAANAAYAANAADNAANAAAYAANVANAAANAAYAANAANAAAYAANAANAAAYAVDADNDAYASTKKKIVLYGISLLKEKI